MRRGTDAWLPVVVGQRTPPVTGCVVQHRAIMGWETLPPSVIRNCITQAPAAETLLVPFEWASELVSRIATVFGPHKRQYLPKVVRIFDDRTEWRHRPHDTFTAYAPIAAF